MRCGDQRTLLVGQTQQIDGFCWTFTLSLTAQAAPDASATMEMHSIVSANLTADISEHSHAPIRIYMLANIVFEQGIINILKINIV